MDQQQQQQQHQVNIPNAYPPSPPHQPQQQTQTPQPNLINPQQQQQQPNIPIAYPPPLHQSQQQTLTQTQTQTPQPNLTNPQQQQQSNIPNAYPQPLHQSQQTQTQTPLPNLPLGSLIKGSREKYFRIGIPLYEASIKGDWKVAEDILKQYPDLVRSAITENYETPLHIASSAKSTKSVETFVENLVKLMDKKDMELQNKNENTALILAAAAGYVKMAEIMVQKNSAVPEIPGNNRMMPLYVAALFGKQDMVRYLYKKSNMMTGRLWTDQNRSWVLQKCVDSDLFDVALEIASDWPELITDPHVLRDVLSVLARKTAALSGIKPNTILGFLRSPEKESKALELLKHLCERTAIMPTKTIDDIIRGPALAPKIYPSRVLFVAAKMGNMRFIIELIRLYPDLIWKKNDKELTIFHVAVKRRHENIYNLLYEIGSMKDMITPIKDKDGNNMLHLIGKSAKPKRWKTVLGVALQMQRELQWFQEVEQMIPPRYIERKNKDGKTPYELFTEKHLELVKDSADWMKETAAQCMVVAALIATIVFAAAFTLPGGYNQNNGLPMFVPKGALVVFVISDAISLVFSSTSILMFLSIFTSRYAQSDFLVSLPTKLMFGLGALFLSIITMMVAFSASFFLLYHNNLRWVPAIVTSFAAIPVLLFAILQFRLLADIFYSTYRSWYLFRPKTHTLYY